MLFNTPAEDFTRKRGENKDRQVQRNPFDLFAVLVFPVSLREEIA
jgi:hypothetical protein